MLSSRARQRCFVGEIGDIVNGTASAVANVTITEPVVQVHQDRRGWEVHVVVAEEELHCAQQMLDAAKNYLGEACQVSRFARLLSNRNPWKDVRCGFRALIAFMEDETRACKSVYELSECPDRAQCSYQHPRCIKRFFMVVKSTKVPPTVDSTEGKCEGAASTSISTQSAQSGHSTASSRSAQSGQSGQNWQSVGHCGSVGPLFGYINVEADGSSKSEGSPVGPLVTLPLHPHLLVSCKSNFEHPRHSQAPPLHESVMDIPMGSPLMSGFIISL